MKKLLGFFVVLFLLVSSVSFAYADNDSHRINREDRHDNDQKKGTTWEVSGACEITYTLDKVGYVHTDVLIATGNGMFIGTGQYNPDPSYVEDVNGAATGSTIAFHVVYAGTNAGYFLDATGTIDNAGRLKGTAISSTGQAFTFVSSASCAQKTGNDGHEKNFKCDRERR